MTPRPLRAATRGSALARWQTDHVAALLGVPCEVVVVQTTGDQRQDLPIAQIGGQGVFVKEVQAAVLDGRADIAVHSAKDLPSSVDGGLVIGAVPVRGDARDALVGSTLAGLGEGAVVGTGSVRRQAQLAGLRPDLRFASLRGNIDTRLSKAADFGAIVMAAAALQRLGRTDAIAEILEPSVMLPQVAQGALAVECRAGDEETLAALAGIEDTASRLAVDAERAFLAELGGGCDLPVGALASVVGDIITMEGLLAAIDGTTVLRRQGRGPASDPGRVGREVALALLAEGGRALLDGPP